MAQKRFFGRDGDDGRRGNPFLGDEGAAGLLSGRNPLSGRRPSKKTPEEKASKKNADKRKKAKPKDGIEDVPGYKAGVPDAYERGQGARPNLGPGQHLDPNHGYGTGSGNLGPGAQMRTGAGQILAENAPHSVYTSHLASLGLPTDPIASNFGRTLQNLYESVLLPNYNTARTTQNQELTLDTFLRDWEGGMAPATVAPQGAASPPAPTNRPINRAPQNRMADPGRLRQTPPQRQQPGVGPGAGRGLANPFLRQRPGGGQQRQPGAGNPFLGENPLLGRRRGLGGSLPRPTPKRPATPPRPKPRGPITGRTGTEPVNPGYGATGQDAMANYRNYHLSLDPMRRGENTKNIFGGGSTTWAAYR